MTDFIDDKIQSRKAEHISISLNKNVESKNVTTGLEKYRFEHMALPEISYEDIDVAATFLGKKQRTPFLISSMTGGTKEAQTINTNLAEAAEKKGMDDRSRVDALLNRR